MPDIPCDLERALLDNPYDNYVKPDGRLTLGPWNDQAMEAKLSKFGFIPSGYCEKTVPGIVLETKRMVSLDKETNSREIAPHAED